MDSSKRLWIWTGIVLVAGVGLVSVAGKKKAPASLPSVPLPLPVGSGSRVLLVGDSLAAGLGPPMKQLVADAGGTLAVDGRVATLIDQWAQKPWLAAALESVRPSHVLVSLGTNDMKLTEPLAEAPSLQKLVDTLRASGASLVWIAPPTMPFPDRGVRAMVDATGVAVFRSESLSIARGPDGIHPTASGYAGWAAQIVRALRPTQALGAVPVRRVPPVRRPRRPSRRVAIPGSGRVS